MRFLLLAVLILAGCESDSTMPQPAEAPTIPKRIAVKQDAIENRTDLTIDWDGSLGTRNRAQTVFYLFAEDGTYVEVDMPTFVRTKVGDMHEARVWRK